jgi:hypothetical protein
MTKLLARILTRSFPGKDSSLYGDSTAIVEAPDSSPERQSSEYESRAFAMWEELLGRLPGCRILELGALSPQSLGFFAERGAMLSVMSINLDEPENSLQHQLDGFATEQPFQGALCWDLPNYMSADDFQRLGVWLGEHMLSGAVVMLCLATQVPYPGQPGRYVIAADDRLKYQAASLDDGGQDYRISTGDLGRHWADFEVERSFLLRNGMQEYVLRRL